jgi:hypothetical protein
MNDDDDVLFSWSGLVGATVTVLITTLDDSVWLVSFVGTSSLSKQARLVHAATFLATLCGLAVLCGFVAIFIQTGVAATTTTAHGANPPETLEVQLEGLAVVICWLLAIGFYIKKLLKQRRRQRQVEAAASTNDSIEVEYSYGAVDASSQEEEEEEGPDDDDDEKDDWNRLPTSSQPWTVVSLTTLGFLDEISYFPALILGHLFSVWELVLGTLVNASH